MLGARKRGTPDRGLRILSPTSLNNTPRLTRTRYTQCPRGRSSCQEGGSSVCQRIHRHSLRRRHVAMPHPTDPSTHPLATMMAVLRGDPDAAQHR